MSSDSDHFQLLLMAMPDHTIDRLNAVFCYTPILNCRPRSNCVIFRYYALNMSAFIALNHGCDFCMFLYQSLPIVLTHAAFLLRFLASDMSEC
jgi:hypothetical protein